MSSTTSIKPTTTTAPTSESTILLTGATGFLGHHLLAAFDKKGVKVSALIRSPEGASRLPGKPFVVRGSPLSPPAATKAGVAGVKTIIHTAAVVKHSQNVPKDLYPLNIDGTLNMVRLAAELGARMIFVSTSGTVGTAGPASGTGAGPASASGARADSWSGLTSWAAAGSGVETESGAEPGAGSRAAFGSPAVAEVETGAACETAASWRAGPGRSIAGAGGRSSRAHAGISGAGAPVMRE